MSNMMLDLANYTINRASNKGTPITNLQLQKILYFTFVDELKKKNNDSESLLKRIYDEPFLVWRYGPVVESVYERYNLNGSSPILFFGDSENDYSLLAETIDNLIGRNVFELVNKSHRHSHWKKNEDKIKYGRSSIKYEFEDLKNA